MVKVLCTKRRQLEFQHDCRSNFNPISFYFKVLCFCLRCKSHLSARLLLYGFALRLFHQAILELCFPFEFGQQASSRQQQHSDFNSDPQNFLLLFFLDSKQIKGETFFGPDDGYEEEIYARNTFGSWSFILKANGINLSSIWTWLGERSCSLDLLFSLHCNYLLINIYDFLPQMNKYLRPCEMWATVGFSRMLSLRHTQTHHDFYGFLKFPFE